MDNNYTKKLDGQGFRAEQVRDILTKVHASLIEKGYNPISQLCGYLLSGDPTYITSHNNARSIISQIERDEVIEELLKDYLLK